MNGGQDNRRLSAFVKRAFLRLPLTALTAIAAALALSFALLFALRESRMLDKQIIFFPDKEITQTPADAGLRYEDISFSAADGTRLHGWFAPGTGADTLLWFHGNAGNISYRVNNILMLNRRLGLNVFIFDYRGYGRSEGSPSERGMYADADAALTYLQSRPDVDAGRIILFGRSLGCAVAVETAMRRPVKAVILEAPFTSIKGMAQSTGPLTSLVPIHWLLKSKFDSLSKIASVQSPVMVLHGDEDATVPIAMARALYAAANEPKRFYAIPGADHNDTYLAGGDAYFAALQDFIQAPHPPPAK